MRDVKVNGAIFPVRSLTRGETKELLEKGYNLYQPTLDNIDQMSVEVLNLVLDADQNAVLDKADYMDGLKVFKAVLAETLGEKEEEKNLSGSGSGGQTASD